MMTCKEKHAAELRLDVDYESPSHKAKHGQTSDRRTVTSLS